MAVQCAPALALAHTSSAWASKSFTCLQLTQRLEQEVPAFHWHCQAVNPVRLVSGTELPEEIVISAALEGQPVPGSPFYLSGKMLMRWGIDLAARLICNELTPNTPAAKHGSGLSWDKLAEI